MEPQELLKKTETDSFSRFPYPGRENKPSDRFPCFNCGYSLSLGQVECPSCGIVLTKVQKEQERDESLKKVHAPTPELKILWEEVIEDFEDHQRHQDFVGACYKGQALEFAAYKYACVLSAHQGNQQALFYQRQILALASLPLQEKTTKVRKLPKFSFIVSFLLVTAALTLIVLGLNEASYRNLVGVGAALLFLTLGARIYYHFSRR